jgi:hypothetical protein
MPNHRLETELCLGLAQFRIKKLDRSDILRKGKREIKSLEEVRKRKSGHLANFWFSF